MVSAAVDLQHTISQKSGTTGGETIGKQASPQNLDFQKDEKHTTYQGSLCFLAAVEHPTKTSSQNTSKTKQAVTNRKQHRDTIFVLPKNAGMLNTLVDRCIFAVRELLEITVLVGTAVTLTHNASPSAPNYSRHSVYI